MKAAFSLFFCVLLCCGQVAYALAEAAAGPKRGKAVRVLRIAKGEVFVLKADMYIAKRMTLETDSKLLCAPNTRVILLPGAELLVAAGVQMGCKPGASFTWKGIRCEGQNKVTIAGEPNHEVMIADAEVGIEVQNASSLTITYAKFTGHVVANATRFSELVGTGIQINGPATITNCTFRGLRKAIEITTAGSTPSIKANRFLQNKAAISINTNSSTPTNLDLSCNIFEPGTSATAPYGRWTNGGDAFGIKVISGSLSNIGKYDTRVNPPYLPGANVWPVALGISKAVIPNTLNNVEEPSDIAGRTDWVSPSNWVSILNTGNVAPAYKRFRNEFIGSLAIDGTGQMPTKAHNNQIAYSSANTGIIPSGAVLVDCDVVDGIYLPTLRSIGVSNDSAFASARLDYAETRLLGIVPNPFQSICTVKCFLAEKFKSAFIEVFSIATGHTVKSTSVNQIGQNEVQIELGIQPSGIYGYRLIVDGVLKGTKKMSLVK